MFEQHVSAEPLEIIRKNEAEGDRQITELSTTRFRRLFNEIETAGLAYGRVSDELLACNASNAALLAALMNARQELVNIRKGQELQTGIRFKDGVENTPIISQIDQAVAGETARRAPIANDPTSPSNFTFNMKLITDAHGNIGLQFNRPTAQFMVPPQEATRLGIALLQACGHQINQPNPGPGGGKKTPGGLILPH